MSDGIRPFRIEIPQADLDYLHDRLGNARWPSEPPGGSTSTHSSPPRSTASASTSYTSDPTRPTRSRC
jgi:hypothetical protein